MADPEDNISIHSGEDGSENGLEVRDSRPDDPIYQDLHDDDVAVTVIESLCMQCGQNGTSRLLPMAISHFGNVVVMAFECDDCGFRNFSLEETGSIAEDGGQRIAVQVNSPEGMNRTIVKSHWATIEIPEIELTIPSGNARISTVEGFITQTLTDMEGVLDRYEAGSDDFMKMVQFLAAVRGLAGGEEEFSLVLDDPSGTSFVESLTPPGPDEQMTVSRYERSRAQMRAMGFSVIDDAEVAAEVEAAAAAQADALANLQAVDVASLADIEARMADGPAETGDGMVDGMPHEVVSFPETCSSCMALGRNKMMLTRIPHFKEVIIMAFTCDHCGFRTNEVKSSGAISAQGRRIVLDVTSPEDLARDILKSDTASVDIPEAFLNLGEGTLGGRFTTIEGLLVQVKDQLRGQFDLHTKGDSVTDEVAAEWESFFARVDACIECRQPFTFILDDPLANSFIQNLWAPDPDPAMEITDYERTPEQNDAMGLTGMNTENYRTPEDAAAIEAEEAAEAAAAEAAAEAAAAEAAEAAESGDEDNAEEGGDA